MDDEASLHRCEYCDGRRDDCPACGGRGYFDSAVREEVRQYHRWVPSPICPPSNAQVIEWERAVALARVAELEAWQVKAREVLERWMRINVVHSGYPEWRDSRALLDGPPNTPEPAP